MKDATFNLMKNWKAPIVSLALIGCLSLAINDTIKSSKEMQQIREAASEVVSTFPSRNFFVFKDSSDTIYRIAEYRRPIAGSRGAFPGYLVDYDSTDADFRREVERMEFFRR